MLGISNKAHWGLAWVLGEKKKLGQQKAVT